STLGERPIPKTTSCCTRLYRRNRMRRRQNHSKGTRISRSRNPLLKSWKSTHCREWPRTREATSGNHATAIHHRSDKSLTELGPDLQYVHPRPHHPELQPGLAARRPPALRRRAAALGGIECGVIECGGIECGGIECQEDASVAQRFGAGRLIELSEIYNIACAGEGVGNDRLTRLAQFEGDDKRWWAQLHASQDYRDSAREAALNMFDWRS